MNLPRYLARRIVEAIPLVFAVIVLVFSLIRLTGDPARVILGENATPEATRELRQKWGLDDPLVVQFGRYLGDVLTGDLGTSLRYSRPVSGMITERFGASMLLVGSSVILSILIAVPLGVLAALRWRRPEDALIRLTVVVGQAVPRFYLGILLLLLFGLELRWLPTSGYGDFKHLILPAFTLATPTIALLARLTRSSVLEVLHADYVRTARAKGLRGQAVIVRHVLRNALMAPVTMLAIQAAQLVGGAVIVEEIFGWPGLGRLAMSAIYSRDFPVIQGIVLTFCLIVIVTNILVDISYAFINPRVRSS
jgi:peptide/nickel transport system permease protein